MKSASDLCGKIFPLYYNLCCGWRGEWRVEFREREITSLHNGMEKTSVVADSVGPWCLAGAKIVLEKCVSMFAPLWAENVCGITES